MAVTSGLLIAMCKLLSTCTSSHVELISALTKVSEHEWLSIPRRDLASLLQKGLRFRVWDLGLRI